ncbi:MAG: hypothetical protein IJP14_00540 [Clostridia bacterium]|nr:hypothetical protein [Clostridia bacterium]
MSTFIGTVLTFLITATMQNLVLTSGFDASLMLKITRQPRQIVRFNVLLLLFSVTTTCIFYPIDRVLPTTWILRMLRPLIIVCITCILYIAAILILNRLPHIQRRVRHLLPLTAFNNVVIGVALLLNLQVSVSFWQAVAVAIGASVGFWLLCAVTAEVVERLDNPEIPSSFRGLPGILVFLGLFALALMGFSSVLKLT